MRAQDAPIIVHGEYSALRSLSVPSRHTQLWRGTSGDIQFLVSAEAECLTSDTESDNISVKSHMI